MGKWEPKFCTRIFYSALFLCSVGSVPLLSRTINVPKEAPTIQAGVALSKDGDCVEVEDGIYLEDNVVVDKRVRIKAKNLYGAVIYGTQLRSSSVFIVRAKADIEGFIIKNAECGIVQRESPDIEWEGHDLAFLNINEAALFINDAEKNVGRAILSNIIVDHSRVAVATNDAYGIRLFNGLITNCEAAFSGYHHIYFSVDRVTIWNCRQTVTESSVPPNHTGTSVITQGPETRVLNIPDLNKKSLTILQAAFFQFFSEDKASGPERASRSHFQDWFLAILLADLHAKDGDLAAAQAYYKNALSTGQTLKTEELIWRPLYGLARVAEKLGKTSIALDYYEKAIVSVENIRQGAPLRIYKEGFFQDKLQVYDAAISLLYELDQTYPAKGFDRKALFYAERSRSGGFLESLKDLRSDLNLNLTPELLREQQSITRRTSLIQWRLQKEGLSGPEMHSLTNSLDQVENEFNNLMVKLRRMHDDSSDPRPPQPTIKDRFLMESLGSDTALFVFTAAEDNTHAFMVTSQSLQFVRIKDTGALRSFVLNYLAFLKLGIADEFLGERGGERLYRLLLAPFLKGLDKSIRRLVFIPDDVLCYLPFETLIIEDDTAPMTLNPGKGRARYLVEEFEIAYAPSISFLLRADSRKKKMDILAVANDEDRTVTGLSPSINYHFPALPYASKEVRAIVELFNPARCSVLINEDAQESNIIDAHLSEYHIIHFATHGFYDDENWWRSALVLRQKPDSPDDGFLQPLEICHLPIDADLVVLSACQSGIGKLSRGEGILGLSVAFHAAGARSVISSLWSVNDQSTAILMGAFYSYLAEGKPKAEALRLSKIKLLGTRYRHPFYWAPFILSGDFSASIPLKRRGF